MANKILAVLEQREGTIKKVHEKYGDTVNSIFKNFRGVPHENAEIEAVATLCAGQIGGAKRRLIKKSFI